MVDPRDQKYMPHKRNMIFVRRKGPQSTPSPAILEEAEEAEIGEEEANVGTRSEQMEEASSRATFRSTTRLCENSTGKGVQATVPISSSTH